MKVLIEKIENISRDDNFQRIDENHILDLFIGNDQLGRLTLLLVNPFEPNKVTSTNVIDVFVGQRVDKQWAISFSLKDKQYEEIFINFCFDIFESSKNLKESKNGVSFILARYKNWQNMLLKMNSGLLNINEIKGLIGELYFLKNFMAKEYNYEKAINSWLGPFKADQDFVIEDKWFEVKSTTKDSLKVKISSIPQLDSKIDGNLVILRLEKTSTTDCNKITLNSIVNSIVKEISDDQLSQNLLDILQLHGYINREEYNDMCFRYEGIDRYIVNKDFPCVRQVNLPSSVFIESYELYISALDVFKIS